MSDFWKAFKDGNLLIAQREFIEAANLYHLAIAASNEPSEHALALENLYITAVRTGDPLGGISYLEQAIAADPNSPHMIRMLCALARQFTFTKQKTKALEIQSRIFSHMGWDHAVTAGYDFTQELWFAGNYRTFDAVLDAVQADFDDISIVEIGSLQGMSACYMIDRLHQSRSFQLVCIDPMFQPEYRSNVACSRAPDRVYPIELKSQDALSFFGPNKFQLVHVDGWHVAPQVFLDGFLAAKILVDGGYIIFDDYLKEDQTRLGQTVKMGVQAFRAVFAPWLDLVVDGRQLVCKIRGAIDATSVAARTSKVFSKILGKEVPLTGLTLDAIYFSVAANSDALFAASWTVAETLD